MGRTKKAGRAQDANKTTEAETDAPSTSGRKYTLALAVPGSVIEDAASYDAAASIAGQIARAAVIFNVDEVVVYDDTPGSLDAHGRAGTVSSSAASLARMLQYLETPSYLRSSLMPGNAPEFQSAEKLPPLLAPHHLRSTEWKPYREGAVMQSVEGKGSFVDVGLDRNVYIKEALPMGRRVTLHMGLEAQSKFIPEFSESMLVGQVSSPAVPRRELGTYWGYTVRLARSLSRVMKESPFRDGYDLIIGTAVQGVERDHAELVLPQYTHAVVVLGGTKGLEEIIEGDEALTQAGKTAQDVFNMYLNTCPGQGAATIRTEDAVLISLGYLNGALQKFGKA